MTVRPSTGPCDYWRVAPDRLFDLKPYRLMGVLNVTPDSFSDGGENLDTTAAVESGMRMVREGATIIDVGGESTRPGSTRVDPDLQVERILPVIRRLRDQCDELISVDTTWASVAEAALDAGADVINDISAGTIDGDMFALAARRGCGLILMHRLRLPEEDDYSNQYRTPPEYGDVTTDVRTFLEQRAREAEAAGVNQDCICLDPGLGFGKSVRDNFNLVLRIDEITSTGYPVLVGASRKSFIGAASGDEQPSERVVGSVAASIMAFDRGVRLFRVHDVAEHYQGLQVAEAVRSSSIVPAGGSGG